MKVSILLESFRLGTFEEGLEAAANLKADAVQLYASEDMPDVQVKDYLDKVRDKGMVFSALCGDIGGYNNPDTNAERIGKFKKILDLSMKLGCGIVTTHIGRVPYRSADPAMYEMMLSAITEIGTYADSVGAKLAIETGPEKAHILRHFIDETGCASVGVNLDPANLVMVAEDNAAAAAGVFAGKIFHTHAKDGIPLGFGKYKEVPLGQGAVHFDEYLPALHFAGYNGYLAIECETKSKQRMRDIANAVDFLREMTERYQIDG